MKSVESSWFETKSQQSGGHDLSSSSTQANKFNSKEVLYFWCVKERI